VARAYHPSHGEERTSASETGAAVRARSPGWNSVRSDDLRPVTGSQLRAARALVRWSVNDLAQSSQVAIAAITRGEAEDGPISMTTAEARALRRALEGAGVEFIAENGGGAGVRWSKRSGRPDEGLRPDQLTSENDG
jgi:hypothetical protein